METVFVNEGALLVTVRNPLINDLVHGLALANTLPGGVVSLWLGASDDSGLSQFSWVSGQPFDYENFAAGEPSGPPSLVGIEMRLDSGEWNDTGGTSRLLVTERTISENIFSSGFEDP